MSKGNWEKDWQKLNEYLEAEEPSPQFPYFAAVAFRFWMMRFREAETQCATMREALQDAISLLKGEKKFPEDLVIWGPGGYNVVRIKNVINQGEKALSNDAGRDLLERMAKLEAVAKAAKELTGLDYDKREVIVRRREFEALKQALTELEENQSEQKAE